MSFDKIFDLTAGVYFNFCNIGTAVQDTPNIKHKYRPRLGFVFGRGCVLHQLRYNGSRVYSIPVNTSLPFFLPIVFCLCCCALARRTENSGGHNPKCATVRYLATFRRGILLFTSYLILVGSRLYGWWLPHEILKHIRWQIASPGGGMLDRVVWDRRRLNATIPCFAFGQRSTKRHPRAYRRLS